MNRSAPGWKATGAAAGWSSTPINAALGPVMVSRASPCTSRVELLARVAALESKLTTLPAIEQAKGALMAAYGITADAAFAQLRFHSQNRNVKVRAIAAQLITMLCDSPSSKAITRVERFLGGVARRVQPPT